MNQFEPIAHGVSALVEEWTPRLLQLPELVIGERRNSQYRTIKQIIGHMIDSASNNTHRIVHLHYQDSPLVFPNYATNGNNDRWIAIQNYQEEDWTALVNLWKFSNLHIAHVIRNVDLEKINRRWLCGNGATESMEEGIIDYLRHFKLHLAEIEQLIDGN